MLTCKRWHTCHCNQGSFRVGGARCDDICCCPQICITMQGTNVHCHADCNQLLHIFYFLTKQMDGREQNILVGSDRNKKKFHTESAAIRYLTNRTYSGMWAHWSLCIGLGNAACPSSPSSKASPFAMWGRQQKSFNISHQRPRAPF